MALRSRPCALLRASGCFSPRSDAARLPALLPTRSAVRRGAARWRRALRTRARPSTRPTAAPWLPVLPRCGATATERAPTFAGPSADVEVIRDSLGVPHIYGRSDADVFFASGYLQATDRLLQMELMRRTARGTLAEVLGRDRVEQDRLVRVMGVPFWGRQSAERLRRERPDVDALIDAWTAGVNRRVREVLDGTTPAPAGFAADALNLRPAPWTVEDAYTVGKLILFRNANQLDYDVLATLVHRYAPEAAGVPIFQSLGGSFVVPPEERPGRRMTRRAPRLPRDASRRLARWIDALSGMQRGASNNWAVAARHSANGRPLLAGDPHQPLQSPGVFWAQHMNSADGGGRFDVVGFAFAGAPGVQLGHNRRLGWTATTAYPDMMDMWAVDLDGDAITLGGRAVRVQRCEETLAVRGGEPVTVTVEDVPGYGVLLPNSLFPLPVTSNGQRVLFAWTGFRPTEEAAVFFDMNVAGDVSVFDNAVRRMEIGAFNFIAADARDITYRSQVLAPDRGDTATLGAPWEIMDGADPRALWTTALLPAERQPASRGGDAGLSVVGQQRPLRVHRQPPRERRPVLLRRVVRPGHPRAAHRVGAHPAHRRGERERRADAGAAARHVQQRRRRLPPAPRRGVVSARHRPRAGDVPRRRRARRAGGRAVAMGPADAQRRVRARGLRGLRRLRREAVRGRRARDLLRRDPHPRARVRAEDRRAGAAPALPRRRALHARGPGPPAAPRAERHPRVAPRPLRRDPPPTATAGATCTARASRRPSRTPARTTAAPPRPRGRWAR